MVGIVLSDHQRLDWLRLIRSEGIGPRTFQGLLNRFGSAADALEALPEIAREAGRSVRICRADEAEREIAGLGRLGGRLIALGEAAYPAALRAIDSAPPLLAVLGQVEALSRPSVAVVGSRNASAAGLKFTARLARDLGEAAFVVTSGLARGIDTAAHEASLATGTVAVMAGGLDQVYPPQNLGLFQRIAETGAAVSEMPLGWAPRGRDFPRRNRLVSGLSLGTVVVEAARKSGSLITARFANEQGRQVFAVPGSPLDPRAEGGNHLIREGATLCAEAAHVIDALQPLLRPGAELPFAPLLRDAADPPSEPLWDELDLPGIVPAPLSPEQSWRPLQAGSGEEDATTVLLRLIGHAPIAPDDLVRASGRPAREVTQVLFDLELAGSVQRHPGGLLSRAVR